MQDKKKLKEEWKQFNAGLGKVRAELANLWIKPMKTADISVKSLKLTEKFHDLFTGNSLKQTLRRIDGVLMRR